ncbi:phenylalanine--tRNA ligase beta subunit-related protein [Balneolales bacterium ANBcel1]|nr:phenylalanine--tRNA ligase beta subunit-related protein [Balneolales bacterium ANBcel1]
MLPVENLLRDRIHIGFITADGIDPSASHPELEKRISGLLAQRVEAITDHDDRFRKACRDMMRIGAYKPTGRGKPASEYLLRTAGEGHFPRINLAADINNYISLKFLVPISLWDRDRIEAESWLFRPGSDGEQFIFNPSGQAIGLKDLVTGYAISKKQQEPIVTPVKDCQKTKTDPSTRNIAAAVYYPAGWQESPDLQDILNEFSELLEAASTSVESTIVR